MEASPQKKHYNGMIIVCENMDLVLYIMSVVAGVIITSYLSWDALRVAKKIKALAEDDKERKS